MTRLLRAEDVRALITPADALEAVRGAFVRLAAGEATVPEIMDFEFPAGEAHVKGALAGRRRVLVGQGVGGVLREPGDRPAERVGRLARAVGGRRAARGGRDGRRAADRAAHGAAGALAASLLARPELEQVCVVGAGGQARFQVEALLGVRSPARVVVWARRRSEADCVRRRSWRRGSGSRRPASRTSRPRCAARTLSSR